MTIEITPGALVRGLLNTFATYGSPSGHAFSDRRSLANEEDALTALVGIGVVFDRAHKEGTLGDDDYEEACRLLLVVREFVRPLPEVWDEADGKTDLARQQVEASVRAVRKAGQKPL